MGMHYLTILVDRTRRMVRQGHESFHHIETLPPDLLAQACRRLGLAGLGYASLWAVYFVALLLIGVDMHAGKVIAGLTSIPMGLAIYLLSLRPQLVPERFLCAGHAFEVLGSFTIALAESWYDLSAHAIDRIVITLPDSVQPWALLESAHYLGGGSISWVCTWVLVFPLVVPATPRRNFIASLLAAAMLPLTQLLSFWVNGVVPALQPAAMGLVIASVISTTLCAIIAMVGGQFLYQLGADVSRARQMGSYRLLECLGQGGMGEVWRAEHQMLARPAAIKLIRQDTLRQLDADKSATLLQRFEREAQATAALASPHAVELYDFGTTADGRFYYVMELLNGVDLHTLVQQFGPQPPERIVHLLRQACHVLAEAHEKGLIHRDIKPANLYVCRYGRDDDFIKVLDFGLVKSTGALQSEDVQLTRMGAITGTPAYLAPEMAMGNYDVDGRADLYGLGCLGYYLMTGLPVFTGRTVAELLVHHARSEPVPPSERLGMEICRPLEELILWCLEKDPEKRPHSASELDRSLEETGLGAGWSPEDARQWWEAHQDSIQSLQRTAVSTDAAAKTETVAGESVLVLTH